LSAGRGSARGWFMNCLARAGEEGKAATRERRAARRTGGFLSCKWKTRGGSPLFAAARKEDVCPEKSLYHIFTHKDIFEDYKTAEFQCLSNAMNNLNQIVKRMNQTGSLHVDDVAEVKKILHDIWLSERQNEIRIWVLPTSKTTCSTYLTYLTPSSKRLIINMTNNINLVIK
jgi:hypothetical protein